MAGSAGASSAQLSADQRRVIHDATKQYGDVDVALSDGYVPSASAPSCRAWAAWDTTI
jgi:hypothetical protein